MQSETKRAISSAGPVKISRFVTQLGIAYILCYKYLKNSSCEFRRERIASARRGWNGLKCRTFKDVWGSARHSFLPSPDPDLVLWYGQVYWASKRSDDG